MLKLALLVPVLLLAAPPASADLLLVFDHQSGALIDSGSHMFIPAPTGTKGHDFFMETAVSEPNGFYVSDFFLAAGDETSYILSLTQYDGSVPCSPGVLTPDGYVSCHFGPENGSDILLTGLLFDYIDPSRGPGPTYDVVLRPSEVPEVSSVWLLMTAAIPITRLARRIRT
jgi:hypothetical protein